MRRGAQVQAVTESRRQLCSMLRCERVVGCGGSDVNAVDEDVCDDRHFLCVCDASLMMMHYILIIVLHIYLYIHISIYLYNSMLCVHMMH